MKKLIVLLLIAGTAHAQNVPNSPYGCFKEHGSTECYQHEVDCGNAIEDVSFEYLESLYGKTLAHSCIENLELQYENDLEFIAGFEYAEELFERKILRLKRRLRKFRR